MAPGKPLAERIVRSAAGTLLFLGLYHQVQHARPGVLLDRIDDDLGRLHAQVMAVRAPLIRRRHDWRRTTP